MRLYILVYLVICHRSSFRVNTCMTLTDMSLKHLGHFILSFCVCLFVFSSLISSFGGSLASSMTSLIISGSSSLVSSTASGAGASSLTSSLFKSTTLTVHIYYSRTIIGIFYISILRKIYRISFTLEGYFDFVTIVGASLF